MQHIWVKLFSMTRARTEMKEVEKVCQLVYIMSSHLEFSLIMSRHRNQMMAVEPTLSQNIGRIANTSNCHINNKYFLFPKKISRVQLTPFPKLLVKFYPFCVLDTPTQWFYREKVNTGFFAQTLFLGELYIERPEIFFSQKVNAKLFIVIVVSETLLSQWK